MLFKVQICYQTLKVQIDYKHFHTLETVKTNLLRQSIFLCWFFSSSENRVSEHLNEINICLCAQKNTSRVYTFFFRNLANQIHNIRADCFWCSSHCFEASIACDSRDQNKSFLSYSIWDWNVSEWFCLLFNLLVFFLLSVFGTQKPNRYLINPKSTEGLMKLLDTFLLSITCRGNIVLISNSVEQYLGHCRVSRNKATKSAIKIVGRENFENITILVVCSKISFISNENCGKFSS